MAFKNNSNLNRNVVLKYANTFTNGSGTVIPVDFSSISNSIITHEIPLNMYSYSVFRLGGSSGNYLNGTSKASFFFDTNFTDITSISILNSGDPLSREGTLRMGKDSDKNSVTVTIPVTGNVRYRTPNNTTGTLLSEFSTGGSIIIKVSNNLEFSDIDYFIKLTLPTTGTRSIDVDRGSKGTGEDSFTYVAGSFIGTFDATSFTKNSLGTLVEGPELKFPTTAPLFSTSAFLLKIRIDGVIIWCTVIDGENVEEGISVAVQDDVLQDQTGRYNVYLSGTFKGDGTDLYIASVYNSTNNSQSPLEVETVPNVVISQSEVGVPGSGGHEESFVVKFNHDGKYIFNYKVTGTEDVSIKYIDVGPNGNVAMCGVKNTPLMRVQEPDGAISRYIVRPKLKCGFLVKFRTAGMLILPTPSGNNVINTYKKSIINTTGLPLYVAVYKENSASKSIPSVSVIPGRKSMDFIYDADTWVPEASDKLTTDLLFLDRDNGRFGFGTTFP
jgi:hypothetical protein